MIASLRILLALACGVLILTPLAVADGSAYKALEGWLQLPEGFSFGEVAGVGVDSHNHVFIFHRGKDKPILCVEADSGKVVASFGEGMFRNAHGLEIDDHDNVWVTDTLAHQIHKFSHDGELLMTVGEHRKPGLDGGHFNQPTDVAVAPSGEFYVSDGYVNSRVAKFAADGTFIKDWGEKGDAPGQFHLPHGIALDDDGRVYVADRTNMRIQVFDADGNFLHQWKSEQLGEKGRPWGLEVAGDGYLYVIDGSDMLASTPNTASVTKLNLNGKVIDRWGSYGPDPGQLSWGHDVAVGDDGAVYTAEVRNNDRAQKFVRE